MTSTFGRYEIISELGRGGMAVVYRAYDPRFKRDVAIKVLPREFLHDPSFRARFEREAQILAALDHPAIVPVYDFGEEDGQPYLVMPYLSGGSLSDRIKQGPLPLDEIVRIMQRLAPGLDEAHERGVIHRDIKPANILFDKRGDPFVSDFGIVKFTEGGTQLTGSGMVGTPAYMAPEMMEPEGLSPLVDIYALGVTLFQMLTGQQPYQADTPAGLLMAHLNKPIPDVYALRPDLPRDLQYVIEKALAKNPRGRYQTAQELAANLNAAATGVFDRPTMAEPDASLPQRFAGTVSAPRVGRAKPRRRLSIWLWIAGIVVAAGLITAGVLAVIVGPKLSAGAPPPLGTHAPTEVPVTTEPPTNTPHPTTTPTLSATPAPATEATPLTAVITAGNAVQVDQLRTLPGVDHGVTWSPVPTADGLELAAGSADGNVHVWNAITGEQRLVIPAHAGGVTDVAWSLDGTRIATASDDGTAIVWDAATGEKLATHTGHVGAVTNLAWSPDSAQIASGSADRTVRVWDATTGSRLHAMSGHSGQVNDVAWSLDGSKIASAANEFRIMLWDAHMGDLLRVIPLSATSTTSAVTWSQDGTRLATGGNDQDVIVWDVATGARLLILEGHAGTVLGLAWSPDGATLVSGGADGRVILWNAATGEKLQTLRGHTGPVNSVAWAPNGAFLASASDDGTVIVWGIGG